ncbi:hypothetical protein Bpfe_021978 [Biomphalaria pfeifferi]|uniref:Uncharacterized protein n=1 Tax=Biomphalaria pfeifferi TaxID=112525 RepID=A0AAD8B5R9_BIOPF|nr:hypothetical protein Bpfe_021978 [Biomphalaria pfeifferi]
MSARVYQRNESWDVIVFREPCDRIKNPSSAAFDGRLINYYGGDPSFNQSQVNSDDLVRLMNKPIRKREVQRSEARSGHSCRL